VVFVAESVPLEDIETDKKVQQNRYFKMQVLNSNKSSPINEVIKNINNQCSVVFSDKSKRYVDISDYEEVHIEEKSIKESSKTSFQWVHIAISNAKRWLPGVHPKIKCKYLQSFLNEFCYKLNRRYFGDIFFFRLILAMAKSYR